MTRDLESRLLIEGVSPDVKDQLRQSAMQLYGQPNASLLVRQLIASHLEKEEKYSSKLITTEEASDIVRVELRLPRVIVNRLDELAEARFSKRNYYISSIIFAHFGQVQLQGDEIETLRRSNYELSKVGTNINQVAKAFNILVNDNRAEKIPEIEKTLTYLKREVAKHTSKVLKVLNAGTTFWESIRINKNK
jgi:predicted DNA-binding protein